MEENRENQTEQSEKKENPVKRFFTEDIGIKIFSLVFGVLLWLLSAGL